MLLVKLIFPTPSMHIEMSVILHVGDNLLHLSKVSVFLRKQTAEITAPLKCCFIQLPACLWTYSHLIKHQAMHTQRDQPLNFKHSMLLKIQSYAKFHKSTSPHNNAAQDKIDHHAFLAKTKQEGLALVLIFPKYVSYTYFTYNLSTCPLTTIVLWREL